MLSENTQYHQEKISQPLVAVIMGSESDLVIMKNAAEVLEKLESPYEIKVVSAHRTPERMVAYSKEAKSRGLEVIIAGAGGAAHLPGMVASLTALPVIGVPVKLKALEGMDALLSIAQMPGGGRAKRFIDFFCAHTFSDNNTIRKLILELEHPGRAVPSLNAPPIIILPYRW